KLVQATSGAVAFLVGTVTGSNPMTTGPYTGTPGVCGSHCYDWVGQTSGAHYTPTSSPVGTQLCTAWPANTGCPIQITLNNPVTQSLPITNGTFIFNSPSVVRKNAFEMKSALRSIVEGNWGGNVDPSGGQHGVCWTITIRNNSGGSVGQNYQANITDTLFSNNYFENCNNGAEFAARSSNVGSGGGGSGQMNRVSLQNDFWKNISNSLFGGDTSQFGILINSGSQTWTVNITENSDGQHATAVATASVDAGAPLESDTITQSAISGSGSNQIMTATTTSNTLVTGETVQVIGTNEACVNGQSYTLVGTPTGTSFVINVAGNGCTNYTTRSDTGKVQGPSGYQVFNINAGQPVYVQGSTPGANC